MVSESKKDRLALRASSLTFTVVLSLVPTLALGTAVLKGLGAGDQMKEAAYRIIDQMEQGGGHPPHHRPPLPKKSCRNLPSSLRRQVVEQPLPAT